MCETRAESCHAILREPCGCNPVIACVWESFGWRVYKQKSEISSF
jgi:hypothetical protein